MANLGAFVSFYFPYAEALKVKEGAENVTSHYSLHRFDDVSKKDGQKLRIQVSADRLQTLYEACKTFKGAYERCKGNKILQLRSDLAKKNKIIELLEAKQSK